MLRKRGPHVYALAGVCKLKDYIELARSKAINIVISPGLNKHGDGWIEINPRFYKSVTDQEADVQIQEATPSRSFDIAASNLPPSPLEDPDYTPTEWWQNTGTENTREDLPSSGASLRWDAPPFFPSLLSTQPSLSHPQGAGSIQLAPTTPRRSHDLLHEITLAPQAASEDPQTPTQTSSTSARISSPSTNFRPNGSELEVDGRFSALVECFRAKKSEDGTTQIHSSKLPQMMKKREPHVYALAGVSKLKDYIQLARSEGIVISPRECKGWHEINPCLYTSDQVDQIQTTPSRSPDTATSTLPLSPFEGPEWTATGLRVAARYENWRRRGRRFEFGEGLGIENSLFVIDDSGSDSGNPEGNQEEWDECSHH